MGCASKPRQPRHTWVQVDKCLRSGSIQTWLASVAFLVALMALLPGAFVGWVAFETGWPAVFSLIIPKIGRLARLLSYYA